MIGQKLLHYEIVEKLGEGGMGVVYKARDSHLRRFVALKVLPPEMVADAERKHRFVQEARSASALNHPNIVTVYDIDHSDGVDFIAMEYIEGKTLDELIGRKGLKLGETLKYAIQIADALATAHAAGIVHRDLKPANVMVTGAPSGPGQVKVLDFGLAKLTEAALASPEDPSLTEQPATQTGMIVGTFSYMSPEQAEGKKVDARSDIFSFGSLLYEMLTGRRPFRRDSPALTLAAILHLEPPPLPAGTPSDLEKVVARCLRKDPERRFQHMDDVKIALQELKEESDSGKLAGPGVPKTPRRRWPWMAAAAVVVLAAASAGLWLARGREPPPPRVVPLTTFAGNENHPSFSPDGNQVVFSWNGEKQDNLDLYVKMIGSATALRLTTHAADDQFPAWSPDGRQIAFLKSGPRTGIYSISPLGGPEQKIADFDAAPAAPAWSPDGKFLLVAKYRPDRNPAPDAGGLFLVPVEGGEPQPFLLPATGRWFRFPAFSPDGRSLAFASCGGLTSAPFCNLSLVGLKANLQAESKPRQLTEADTYRGAGMAWSPDGHSLVYSSTTSTIIDTFLFRLDVAGGAEPKRLEMASQGASYPALARKGHRLAFSRWVQDSDVWRLRAGNKPEPVLVSSAVDLSAEFSPDGRRIAFGSTREGEGMAIWLANADGSGPVQLTRGPEDYHGSPRWSPDGRWIAFDARGKDGRWNIKVVESSGGQARQFTSGPSSSNTPAWSRDGKWIYFSSDRTGRSEIWRMPSQGGPAEQITRDGGYVVQESPDASTLYYTKTGDAGPLFSRPLRGGEEGQVLERVTQRGFALFEDGIYYLSSDPARPAKSEIRFHEFATGRSRLVSPIEARLFVNLSVSPDRKTFLFTQFASAGSDLMLIENFP